MTKTEAAKLVAVLIAAFPHGKLTPQTSAVYEDMLSDLDYATTNAAVRRLMATARFLPTIAEIRGAALEVTHGQARPGGDAWGDVLDAVSRFGSYRRPVFDDPVVDHAVAAFGWQNICLSENQQADRARFIELYDRLTTARAREAQMPPDVRQLTSGSRATLGTALVKNLKLVPEQSGEVSTGDQQKLIEAMLGKIAGKGVP